jgi:UDP-N-acetylglucosamine 1-carboxyvinyltransferase
MKISCNKRPLPYDILKTQPYPGFPTDMQSQLMTVLSLADGASTIIEEIFESRFQNAKELNKMGANITVENENKAVIRGVNSLQGGLVRAYDLRAGAALVIAGLAALGTTVIRDVTCVERGYEDICRDLRSLGASINYCSDNILACASYPMA